MSNSLNTIFNGSSNQNNQVGQVQNFERNAMKHNLIQSSNVNQNSVIPDNYNQRIINNSTNNIPIRIFDNPNENDYDNNNNNNTYNNNNNNNTNNNNNNNSGNGVRSELTGGFIPDFNHNNMEPFFGGSIKQNVNVNTSNQILLDKFTGNDKNYRKKTEVKSFSDKTEGMSNVNGMQSFTQLINPNERYIPSQKKQGILPFEKIQVGPGLGKGYTAKPSGGFQQSDARQYMIPKNVDELRVKTNPQISYEGRTIKGALPGGSRGKQGSVKKNRPETYYRKTPDMYFKTGGAVKAAMLRNKFYAKPVNKHTRPHYGALGSVENAKTYKRGTYKKTTKNNYMTAAPRNTYSKDTWKSNKELADYGKNSIENKPNERDITQKRSVLNNLTIAVKKIITPLQDMLRTTRKENFIGNNRPDGNMKADMPSKLTVHDPNDIARTTIKETNIHNNHSGNMTVISKLQVHDPTDIARTTIKETNIHNEDPNRNMAPQRPKSLRVYDPEDIARTTIKETNIHNEHTGFIGVPEITDGGYKTTNVKMRHTNKQFTSDYEYSGNPDGDVGSGGGKGYLAANYKAKITQKQFLSDHEYKGVAGSMTDKPMSYSDKYNARMNPNKEKVSKGRKPTKQSTKLMAGRDHVNVQHKKIEGDVINIREPAENRVYQAPPQKNNCGLTVTRDKLPEKTQRSRLNPDLLDAYRQNPYTQSLASSV
jgi:hypothetical protein